MPVFHTLFPRIAEAKLKGSSFSHHSCTPSSVATDDTSHANGSDAGTYEHFRVMQ